jgi:hypothetical protein
LVTSKSGCKIEEKVERMAARKVRVVVEDTSPIEEEIEEQCLLLSIRRQAAGTEARKPLDIISRDRVLLQQLEEPPAVDSLGEGLGKGDASLAVVLNART